MLYSLNTCENFYLLIEEDRNKILECSSSRCEWKFDSVGRIGFWRHTGLTVFSCFVMDQLLIFGEAHYHSNMDTITLSFLQGYCGIMVCVEYPVQCLAHGVQ